MFWLASTSFVALTLDRWEVGTYQEVRTKPRVLDLRLSSLSCMDFREEDYDKKVKHIVHRMVERAIALDGTCKCANISHRIDQSD